MATGGLSATRDVFKIDPIEPQTDPPGEGFGLPVVPLLKKIGQFFKSDTAKNIGTGLATAGSIAELLRKNSAARDLERFSTAGFGANESQRFLPFSLRSDLTSPGLTMGIQGVLNRINNPGGLAPNVAEAIAPRVSIQSERTARDFTGIRQNQAGALARTNAPVSIRTALQSALDVAQERAQRDVRREALAESEQLRRQDQKQVFALLDAILQFMSSGRGQAIPGLQSSAGINEQRGASRLAFLGDLLSNA